MKRGKLKECTCMSLIEFQPRLAKVIFDLTRTYREIEQEKRRRIECKQRYSAKWFATRMNFLSKQQKLLNEAICIGRGIGDAFVWFFYQRDRHYLAEHLAQPAQLHAPPGIGGMGELEFVKHVHMVRGYFVLYHGATNMLRLGDFTLIDLKSFRVAGIGELKSHSSEVGKLEMTLLCSGPRIDREMLLADLGTSKQKEGGRDIGVKLSPKGKARLERQMQRISTSYKKLGATPDRHITVEMAGQFKELATLVEKLKVGQFSYKRLGTSILLAGYKGRKKTLYRKLSDSGEMPIDEKLAGIENLAIDLMAKDRTDNTIIVDSLYYDADGKTRHIPGMTHMVWWPIGLDIIKSILFQDVIIITIFNPAHFIASLEKAGFSVEETGVLKYKVSRKRSGYEFVVEGMSYYLEMIQQYLISDESIVSLLNETEEQIDTLNGNGARKIELRIEQKLGREPLL